MPDLPRTHLLLYAVAGVALLVVGWRQVSRPTAERSVSAPVQFAPDGRGARDGGRSGGGALVVDVAGAVRRPGVYRLRAGARVDDALRRAGGPRPRAELTQVNRAQELEDGRQVLVPFRTPAPAPGTAAAAAAPAGPINLNTATLEQLDTLSGVGPATAQQILDYREQQGGFNSVDELDQVPGIGETRLATLRELVTV